MASDDTEQNGPFATVLPGIVADGGYSLRKQHTVAHMDRGKYVEMYKSNKYSTMIRTETRAGTG